jgi:hypothetical protein
LHGNERLPGNYQKGRRKPVAQKRELIEPNEGDKRYIRRDAEGKFTEDQASISKSLRADVQQTAKKTVPKGQGDKGDQKK